MKCRNVHVRTCQKIDISHIYMAKCHLSGTYYVILMQNYGYPFCYERRQRNKSVFAMSKLQFATILTLFTLNDKYLLFSSVQILHIVKMQIFLHVRMQHVYTINLHNVIIINTLLYIMTHTKRTFAGFHVQGHAINTLL